MSTILKCIKENEGITFNQLDGMLRTFRRNLSDWIYILEKMGVIRRTKGFKGAKPIYITNKGLKLLEEISTLKEMFSEALE